MTLFLRLVLDSIFPLSAATETARAFTGALHITKQLNTI